MGGVKGAPHQLEPPCCSISLSARSLRRAGKWDTIGLFSLVEQFPQTLLNDSDSKIVAYDLQTHNSQIREPIHVNDMTAFFKLRPMRRASVIRGRGG